MSDNPYVFDATFVVEWLKAFALTQIVEMPIYAYAFRLNRDFSWPKSIGLAFVPSLITHPILWFVFVLHWPFFWHVHPEWAGGLSLGYLTLVVVGETLVAVTEGLFLYRMKIPAAGLWSIGANLISLSLGYLLDQLGVT